MGQNDVGEGAPENGGNVGRLQEIMANQQFVNLETRNKLLADAAAPASSSAAVRVWQVTRDGFHKIDDGFIHSLDPNNILPNVAIGAGIGAATKLILPAGGPVAKVAGTAIGVYFIGKPMVESYGIALKADNQEQMDMASTHLGDAIGGLPVAMVEGGIGAAIGSRVTGRILGTRFAAPFVSWKDAQYSRLDGRFDAASAGARNIAFEQLGIGAPVMRSNGGRTGVVPPHMLETLAKTTRNPAYLETIRTTETLSLHGRMRLGSEAVAKTDFKGAREVFDAQGRETVGVKVRSEGQKKTGNADVDNVYDFSGDVRGFFRDVHGRNSIDNRGMKLESTVNYGRNYENAFWDGTRMTYGRPGPESPFKTFVLRDITGHEISHGVTEFSSRMVYRNQPGALNEHVSDVFGALVQQRTLGQSANQASWLVGEGIWREGVKGRALRDMRNPGTAYDDVLLGKDPQPAHMRDFVRTRSDNGGVHINSGIPNRAFVLFSDSVGGKAYDVPGKIWYEALQTAGETPSFAQFAYRTVEAARKLGYTDAVPKLEKAWKDVGITPSLTDTGISGNVPLLVGTPDQRGR